MSALARCLGSSFGELFVGTVDAIDTISHVLLECFYRAAALPVMRILRRIPPESIQAPFRKPRRVTVAMTWPFSFKRWQIGRDVS